MQGQNQISLERFGRSQHSLPFSPTSRLTRHFFLSSDGHISIRMEFEITQSARYHINLIGVTSVLPVLPVLPVELAVVYLAFSIDFVARNQDDDTALPTSQK